MRTTVMCVQCHDDLRQAGSIPDQGHYDGALDTHIVAEFGNDFVLRVVCPRGHRSIGTVGRHRFDLLFESGVHAFLSGFESEAVLSFAAALERAQVAFVWLSLRDAGLE